MHPADPLGSLTPAEVPLIEAEKLSEQAGPPHIAAAGVVIQRKLWTESRTSRAQRECNRDRARPGDGIGREFLVDAANGTAAFRQRDLRRTELPVNTLSPGGSFACVDRDL